MVNAITVDKAPALTVSTKGLKEFHGKRRFEETAKVIMFIFLHMP
jgi:hypothetical protein